MIKKVLAAFVVTAGLMAGADFSIGIQIGPPPAQRVLRRQPASPGAGYAWIDGYWYPNGGRYRWHDGYWTRPPYEGARWIGPRHDQGKFYNGYWEENQQRQFGHDHKWDRERNRRDGDRDRDDRR